MSVLLEQPNSRRHGLSSRVVKRLEFQIKDDTSSIVEKIITWRNLLSFVEASEELLLEDEKNSELLAIHRDLTETSIVLGEFLLNEAGLAKGLEQMSCTVDDFRAKITMLRYKDRMWHGDLSSEKSEQVLASLFGVLP